jgi:hypothetical protein
MLWLFLWSLGGKKEFKANAKNRKREGDGMENGGKLDERGGNEGRGNGHPSTYLAEFEGTAEKQK